MTDSDAFRFSVVYQNAINHSEVDNKRSTFSCEINSLSIKCTSTFSYILLHSWHSEHN